MRKGDREIKERSEMVERERQWEDRQTDTQTARDTHIQTDKETATITTKQQHQLSARHLSPALSPRLALKARQVGGGGGHRGSHERETHLPGKVSRGICQ